MTIDFVTTGTSTLGMIAFGHLLFQLLKIEYLILEERPRSQLIKNIITYRNIHRVKENRKIQL